MSPRLLCNPTPPVHLPRSREELVASTPPLPSPSPFPHTHHHHHHVEFVNVGGWLTIGDMAFAPSLCEEVRNLRACTTVIRKVVSRHKKSTGQVRRHTQDGRRPLQRPKLSCTSSKTCEANSHCTCPLGSSRKRNATVFQCSAVPTGSSLELFAPLATDCLAHSCVWDIYREELGTAPLDRLLALGSAF